MKGKIGKVGEYKKMEWKKNNKTTTENLDNVRSNTLKEEKKSKINISLKIAMPIVIAILLVTFIVSFILLNYNKQSDNYQLSGSQEYQATTYSDEYKKTSDLTDADLTDAYQKNYQKTTADDGSYLIKSAEWTDKQKGEGLITIQGAQYQELEETSALYVATMCYAHGLTEDILVRNIQTLIKYYDKVDFIAINN